MESGDLGPGLGAGVGGDPLAGVVRTKRDPDPLHAPSSCRRMPTMTGRTAGVDSRVAQGAADLEERACLALARDRLLRPGALERGELADDDADEQQQERGFNQLAGRAPR